MNLLIELIYSEIFKNLQISLIRLLVVVIHLSTYLLTYTIYHLLYWIPGLGRKGPMKQGLSVRPSVFPSFRLSVSFLGIGLLAFSETQHGVRNPYIVVCDRAGLFGKKSPSDKNDQKWSKMTPKTWFLDFLRKSSFLRLLKKLQHYGIKGKNLSWFESYLTG